MKPHPRKEPTRRQFLKQVGGVSLALGTQPLWSPSSVTAAPRNMSPQELCRATLALVEEFKLRDFQQPEAVLWPGYFWLWNAALDPAQLRAQLQDMAAHDARSVCLLPMPRAFRPDSTNNSLAPDYLTPEYFDRVGDAVNEAARLGLAWWLYDEGGWPSGQATGHVVEGHPELVRQGITRERLTGSAPREVPADALALVTEQGETKVLRPGERWSPASAEESASLYRVRAGGGVDLLNPEATRRFLALTHEGYAKVSSAHFGRTVKFMFTDEPTAGMPHPPGSVPWFPGLPEAYASVSGRNFFADLPRFFAEAGAQSPVDEAQARVALYDVFTRRFATAYFDGLKNWGRAHGLASGGHLGGEDETLGAIRYGFGHLLRQLRELDLPGVDLIWRQLFPGKSDQSNFPVAAASVAHQNGTRFAFSESFCVYGNGLTPAQMKWLTDYQYLRGLNVLVLGCYPLSTRDHHMTGERPHFGPMNPLWDHLPGYHAYVARLGYALSVGQPLVSTAIYYPARDMWARGNSAQPAVDSYEKVGTELMDRQCPYDLIDDDLLIAATVAPRELVAGAMRYHTVVVGSVQWMHPQARERLHQFAAAGGQVLSVDHRPGTQGVPGTGGADAILVGPAPDVAALVPSLVQLTPPCREIRVAGRQLKSQRIVVFFNEGQAAYRGSLGARGRSVSELDLETGAVRQVSGAAAQMPLELGAGETRAYLFSSSRGRSGRKAPDRQDRMVIDPAEIRVTMGRQFVVGDHDFETRPRTFERRTLADSAVWKTWLGEDFSGEMDYEFTLTVPKSWAGSAIEIQTGPIEYAATVLVDGAKAGQLLWAPWRLVLPPCRPGSHRITLRVANTLANELTSERVTRDWSQKKGPGWPSPYHQRALVFERESRGGGLTGPVTLTRLASRD